MMTPSQLKTTLITVALIGLFATMGALAAYTSSIRRERDQALERVGAQREALRIAQNANEGLRKTVATMAEKARDDAESFARVADSLEVIEKASRFQSAQLTKLENENETVRNYMSARVPADVVGLWNDAGTGNGGANGNSVPAPASAPRGKAK